LYKKFIRGDKVINYIWFLMIFLGAAVGLVTGQGDAISTSIMKSTDSAVNLIIGLVGVMCFWCGVMKVAEKSGFTNKLAGLLKPILKLIFKDAAKDEKVLGAIVMNITANMMGLGNAATPFGIKAMQEMTRLNREEGKASNDMVLFLVLNAACIQLVPSTVISIRAAAGSLNPGIIILPAVISSTIAAVCGVVYCKILERYF